ncbi:OsmC family protein [Psychrobacter sp. K31L]|uniref:OsmC family protein n=1 Tax=Psychrobacter sp. K31L TaxID=2820758 RepID=UPI001B318DEC|nr:OsmC family protein [Psychrobacter sp. K31L]MBP3946850.1 OsmC family protein [Psychrobacter sp. K31L]
MTTSKVTYQGDLRTTAIHLQSNNEIITDAPIDNHGKGEAFSPTDLLATSLASCMLTIVGIKAHDMDMDMDMDIDIAGTTAEVTKVMAADPRRVSEIHIIVKFNRELDDRTQTIFYNTALTCPVAKSIHPDITQNITFRCAKPL